MKKAKIILIIIPVLFIIGLKAFPFYLRSKLTKQMIAGEKSMNSALPLRVDESLSLIEIKTGPELQIEYIYLYSDKNSDTMSTNFLNTFDSLSYSNAKKGFAQNRQMRLFRKYGGELKLTYKDQNSKIFSQIPIKYKMMKSHASWQLSEALEK